MKNLNVSGVSGISYLAVIRPIPQKRVTLLKRGESLCSRNLPSAGGYHGHYLVTSILPPKILGEWRFLLTFERMKNKVKLLFICLGNICRSPAANAVMQQKVDAAGLADRFLIDSAGIGGWHVGSLPDIRMRDHGARRGYRVDHIARQFDPAKDFDRFDYIIVMDDDNYHDVCRMAHNEAQRRKVIKMCDWLDEHRGATSVPDPYYGQGKDFDYALDLIEDGCTALLRHFAGE